MLDLSAIVRSPAILVVALAIGTFGAACGADSEQEPSPPSTAQPVVNLEGLSMTGATTGREVMDRISEAEGACLSTALGEDSYETFVGSAIQTDYQDVGELDPLFGCLTPDNFVLFGVNFAAARAGVAEESRTCLIALGREHPDAVVEILGVETPPEAVTAMVAETRSYLLALYDCLSTEEQAELTVNMWSELSAYEYTGKEVRAALTEREFTCYADGSSLTPNELEATIYFPPVGKFASVAIPCITDNAYDRLLVAALSPQIGGLSEESGTCIVSLDVEHLHLMEAVRVGTFDPSTMDQEQFVEIVEDGLRLYSCLTDKELRGLQTLAARAMSSLGESVPGHAE